MEAPWVIVVMCVSLFIGYSIGTAGDRITDEKITNLETTTNDVTARLGQARRSAEWWRDRQAAGDLNPATDYEWILRDLEAVTASAARRASRAPSTDGESVAGRAPAPEA